MFGASLQIALSPGMIARCAATYTDIDLAGDTRVEEEEEKVIKYQNFVLEMKRLWELKVALKMVGAL